MGTLSHTSVTPPAPAAEAVPPRVPTPLVPHQAWRAWTHEARHPIQPHLKLSVDPTVH